MKKQEEKYVETCIWNVGCGVCAWCIFEKWFKKAIKQKPDKPIPMPGKDLKRKSRRSRK